jgi:D-3-phosphoglycerate dehydrogenase
MKYSLIYFKRTNIHLDNLKKLKEKFNLILIDNFKNIFKISKDKIKLINTIYVDQNYNLNKKFFQKFKFIKYILSSTTSTSFIDETYCKNKKIKIFSLERQQKFLKKITSTAEHVFGLILLISRNYKKAIENVNQGKFDRRHFAGNKMLSKSSIGIVGYGRLGRIVENIAKGFNLKVITYDKAKDKKSKLFHIFNTVDYVSLNIPLSNNRMFFSKKNFPKNCQNKFYLINTSRGEIIDEKFIIYLLKKKILLGYATDVVSQEFTYKFNLRKNILFKNRHRYNIVITPHIGGSTQDAWKLTQDRVIKQLFNYLK